VVVVPHVIFYLDPAPIMVHWLYVGAEKGNWSVVKARGHV
jgi:hypothetical protein